MALHRLGTGRVSCGFMALLTATKMNIFTIYKTIRTVLWKHPFFAKCNFDCCGQETVGLDCKLLMALKSMHMAWLPMPFVTTFRWVS